MKCDWSTIYAEVVEKVDPMMSGMWACLLTFFLECHLTHGKTHVRRMPGYEGSSCRGGESGQDESRHMVSYGNQIQDCHWTAMILSLIAYMCDDQKLMYGCMHIQTCCFSCAVAFSPEVCM